MTRTLSLPLHRAITAAKAIHPHTSSDNVTPVLTVAQVIDGHLVATDRYSMGKYSLATDETHRPKESLVNRPAVEGGISRERYESDLADWERQNVIHIIDSEEDRDPEDHFLIPRDALYWLTRINAKRDLLGLPLYARVNIDLEGSCKPGSKDSPHVTVSVIEPWTGGEPAATMMRRWETVIGRFPPVGRLLDEWAPEDEGQATFGFMPSNIAKITAFAGRYEPIKITAGKKQGNGKVCGPMKVEIGTDFVALIQPAILLR